MENTIAGVEINRFATLPRKAQLAIVSYYNALQAANEVRNAWIDGRTTYDEYVAAFRVQFEAEQLGQHFADLYHEYLDGECATGRADCNCRHCQDVAELYSWPDGRLNERALDPFQAQLDYFKVQDVELQSTLLAF